MGAATDLSAGIPVPARAALLACGLAALGRLSGGSAASLAGCAGRSCIAALAALRPREGPLFLGHIDPAAAGTRRWLPAGLGADWGSSRPGPLAGGCALAD